MPLDPSIFNYNPTPIEAPVNALMRGLQMQHLQRQNALQDMQLQQARQAQADQERQRAFVQGLPSPQQSSIGNALAAPRGPGFLPPTPAPVDQRLQMLHGAMQAGLVSPTDYIGALTPKPKLTTVAPGASIIDENNPTKPLFTAPNKETEDPFVRLLKASGIDPTSPQGQALIQDRLRKESTHQPGVSVSYGAPVAGEDLQGNRVFFQPSKDGKPPSLVQGVVPPKKDDKAPPVEFTKSVAGLKELANGLQSYEKALKDNGGPSPVAMGSRRAALQGAYTSLQMGLKNAFELGALAGPDLGLLQGMLTDPTSPQAMLVGDKGIAAQIKEARQYLKNRGRAVYDAHKMPVPPEYQDPSTSLLPGGVNNGNDPLGLRR